MYIGKNGNILTNVRDIIVDIIEVNFSIDRMDIPFVELGVHKNIPANNSVEVRDMIQSDLSDLITNNDLSGAVKVNDISVGETVEVSLDVLGESVKFDV